MLTSVTIGCPHAAWLSYRAPLLRLFRCFVHRSNSCPIVNGCGFGTPGNDVLPDLARAESRLAKLQWSLWTPTTTQRLPSLFSFLPFARIMALLREDQSKRGSARTAFAAEMCIPNLSKPLGGAPALERMAYASQHAVAFGPPWNNLVRGAQLSFCACPRICLARPAQSKRLCASIYP
jgi:hypothetical protein